MVAQTLRAGDDCSSIALRWGTVSIRYGIPLARLACCVLLLILFPLLSMRINHTQGGFDENDPETDFTPLGERRLIVVQRHPSTQEYLRAELIRKQVGHSLRLCLYAPIACILSVARARLYRSHLRRSEIVSCVSLFVSSHHAGSDHLHWFSTIHCLICHLRTRTRPRCRR